MISAYYHITLCGHWTIAQVVVEWHDQINIIEGLPI